MASYLRQYTTGRKSWLDVMNAQREQTQARYSAVDVAAGVLLSSLKLDILTGRLNRASLSAKDQPRSAAQVSQQ
jgi:adhesin transport system outer membrane protein